MSVPTMRREESFPVWPQSGVYSVGGIAVTSPTQGPVGHPWWANAGRRGDCGRPQICVHGPHTRSEGIRFGAAPGQARALKIEPTEAMMELNDLLIAQSIDPKEVLVLRHRPSEPELRKVLPWLAAEKPDFYNAYQQTQGPKVEKAMMRAGRDYPPAYKMDTDRNAGVLPCCSSWPHVL